MSRLLDNLETQQTIRRLLMVPLSLLAFPLTTMAVTITNVTTHTTVFKDDFETGAFNASVGSWANGPSTAVISSTTPPNPGPFQGSFYASSFRDSTAGSQGDMGAILSSNQTTLGDDIHLDMMVYLPSASDVNVRAQFMLADGGFNGAEAWVRPDGAGHVIAVGPGLSSTNTGLSYAPDVWQRWELDYEIGTTTFAVTVNGVHAAGFASNSVGIVSQANLLNGVIDPAGGFFLDASVPEPSSVMLAALGFIGLAAWGWRRR